MIKITNNEGRRLVVTKGAYGDLYKPLGYYVMDSEKKVVVNDIKEKEIIEEEKETKAEEIKEIKNYKRK